VAKAHPIWTNFTGGEFSPLLEGRIDLNKYFNAGRILKNMVVHPHGPASNRSGFRYIATTKDSLKKSRLIPFEFSIVQAYMLEFGHEYIRFYMDQGQIVHTLETVNAWNDSTEYDPYDYVKHDSVIYRCILTHTNQEPPNATYWVVTDIYEIASPYQESELFEIKYAQSADVMWLTHPNHKPRKLSRTAHTNWTLTEVDFIDGPYEPSSGEEQATLGNDLVINGPFNTDDYWTKGTGWSITGGKAVGVPGSESDIYQSISVTQDEDYEVVVTLSDRTDGTITPKVGGTEGLSRNKNGPYTERITCGAGAATIAFEKSSDFNGKIDDVSVKKVTYNNENNLKPSGVTGSVTIEADLNIFKATDEGRLLRWQADDTNWYWFEITTYANPKNVTATVKGNDLPNTNKSSPFRLGTWCEELGYPSCVAFYEERLGFAGSKGYPQTVWLSASGDYDGFTPGVSDADPITYALAADQVNAIRWMSPGKRLLIGTVGGEWNLGSSGLDDPLTPTNTRVVRETAHGSKNIHAVRVGHVVLFVQKAGKKVRELTYKLEVDSYVAPDMTLLANHITKPQINDMSYHQEPFSIVWCVRSDGVLLGLTYLREQEVVAWHRHTTDGEFESVAVIPGTQEDELWAVVKRTIGAATKRYVEMLESPFDDTDTKSAFFVDSGISYDGAPTTTIGGLNHLEGKEVTVLADGATHPNKTVSGNGITLDREASKVHVGLGYRSVLQTMRLEAGAIDGTAQGRIKRISKVIARFYKTLGCKIGPDENTLDTIFFRDSSMPMDVPPDLFTGDKELDYPEGYETDAHITVVQDLPLPLTVVALMPQIRTTDD